MAGNQTHSASRSSPKWKVDIAKIAATSAVAAFAAMVGSALTYLAATHETENKGQIARLQNDTAVKELNLKMIDLSLAILAGEKGGADERNTDGYILSRDFAIRALSKASEIEISDTDRKNWARAGAIQLGSPQILTGVVNENAPTNSFVYDDESRSRLRVCVGEFFTGCSAGVPNHFTCGANVDDIAAMACPSGATKTLTLNRAGNRCGYAIYDVVCNA